MRKKRWFWMILCSITVAILFIVFQQWSGLNPKAEAFSEQDAKALVERRYKGEVTEIKQKDKQFFIEMVRNEIRYEIKLASDNGEVLDFSKIGNATKASEQNPDQTKPLEKTDVKITEAEAAKIALDQVKGTADDIDLETEDDSTYYLVEVKTGDGREATIQIHAITGGVLSVTWDD